MAQKTNKNIGITANQKLSIQISLSGLSFCVLNTYTKRIFAFEQIEFDKKLNPFEALERLMHYFDTRDYLQISFDDILVVHENDLSTIVPKSLFSEEHLADYLKFNSKILKSDFLSFDVLKNEESVNVYVPYVNINNYIYEAFGSFTFKHFSTILIDEIIRIEKLNKTPKLYVHVSRHHFEIIIIENSKLKIYNTFEYNNAEDFIYYILFTLEQLQLDPETINLTLLGKVYENDALYKIVFKYIRNISVMEQPNKYGFSSNAELSQSSYIITNSF